MSSKPANISITDSASVHIRTQLDLTQSQYLRLGVKQSGCNGYMYTLDFLDSPADNDQCYDFGDGVRVCVNDDDMAMVSGTEIDMVTEGLNSAMVFKNPNASSYCGCGESFAVGGEPADLDILDVGDLATNVGDTQD